MDPQSLPERENRAESERRKRRYICDDPLLTAAEAADETGRGLSTFWRDVRSGRLPPPFRITPRCPRWRRSELRAVVESCRERRNAE